MNSLTEHDELIELGPVSIETKGPAGIPEDTQQGLRMFAGLNDE